uniref:Uncharacterized protein n=1 Tax=Sipha flava TaxID=143950 RepID=A0A2S2R8V9_9HEMI
MSNDEAVLNTHGMCVTLQQCKYFYVSRFRMKKNSNKKRTTAAGDTLSVDLALFPAFQLGEILYPTKHLPNYTRAHIQTIIFSNTCHNVKRLTTQQRICIILLIS